MKIAVVIPTFERTKKLGRCLDALYNSSYKNFEVFVYADGDDVSTLVYCLVYDFSRGIKPTNCEVNHKQISVIGSWNKFFKEHINESWDAVLWLCDDTEIYPNALELAVNSMKEHFPNLDGIIGFTQTCPTKKKFVYKPYGQILIGKKFVERFKDVNYQVCCPFYTFFWQDYELWQYATSLNKFYHCEEAKLIHYHPGYLIIEKDKTHEIVRGDSLKKDKIIHKEREKRNLIWGKSWESIEDYDKKTR